MLGIVSLLELVKVGPVDLAIVTIALVAVFYVMLDPVSAIVALACFVVLYLLGRFVSWPVAIAAFVAGWIFQFIGHRYEGRNPAFFKNLVHLLVGPLWLCALLVRRTSASQT